MQAPNSDTFAPEGQGRRLALQRVRQQVWQMQSADDIQAVLTSVRRCLEDLNIPFLNCGINVLEPAGILLMRGQHSISREGDVVELSERGTTNMSRVWHQGGPVYRRNLEHDDPYNERESIWRDYGQPVRSVLDVPFSHGTLAVNSTAADAFSTEDVSILQELADVLSEGFRRMEDLQTVESGHRALEKETSERQQTDEVLRRTAERLNLLVDFSQTLTTIFDLDTLLRRIVDELGTVLPAADVRVIYLYDAEEQALLPRAGVGYDHAKLMQVRLQPGESTSGKVFQSGQSSFTRTPSEVAEVSGPLSPENSQLYADVIRGEIVQSNICVPLRTATSQIIGTISLSSTHEAFEEPDVDLVEGVAGQIAQAISNAQLFAALEASEERFRLLAEDMPVAITENLPGGEILYYNPRALEMMGYEPDDVTGLRSQDVYVHPEDRQELIRNLHENGFHRYEFQVQRKDGRRIWVRGTTRAISDDAGQVVRYIGISDDVTEERRSAARQRATQQVREQVWRMQSAGDIQQVLVAIRDSLGRLEIPFQDCGINVVNDSVDSPSMSSHSMTSDGTWVIPDEPVGLETVTKFWRDGVPAYRRDLESEDLYQERAEIAEALGHPIRSVLDVPFSHGTLAINSPEPRAFSDEDVTIVQELADVLSEGFRRMEDLEVLENRNRELESEVSERQLAERALREAHDELERRVEERTAELRSTNESLQKQIEERQRAEAQLTTSLQEKETLLKEVHHRVKNNLQVISSLLDLQAHTVEDDTTLTLFRESRNRIHSMALVHEKLYQSEDLSQIDFGEYIRLLAQELSRSYREQSNQIALCVQVDDIFFEPDTAIPCGLIINELVSNALKYAFPKDTNGEICIELHSTGEGQYTLAVGDNGVGFPQHIDFRQTESLGLKLVLGLVQQLRGTVDLVGDKGTEFKIEFTVS